MTDKELAQKVVLHGSHKAFSEIVHRYSGMVFSKALGVLHTEEGAAEDSRPVSNGHSALRIKQIRNMLYVTPTKATPAHLWTVPFSKVTRTA